VPLPLTLKCGRCTRKPVGQWSTEERFAAAKKHYREKHAPVEWVLFCSACGLEFADSLHTAGRHWKNGCQFRSSWREGDSSASSDVLSGDDEAAPSTRSHTAFLEEGKLIVLYPGRQSRCPLEDCPERFVTLDTLKGTMTSLFRHMETSHETRGLKKMWRCSICAIEMEGQKMRHHFNRHSKDTAAVAADVPSAAGGSGAAAAGDASISLDDAGGADAGDVDGAGDAADSKDDADAAGSVDDADDVGDVDSVDDVDAADFVDDAASAPADVDAANAAESVGDTDAAGDVDSADDADAADSVDDAASAPGVVDAPDSVDANTAERSFSILREFIEELAAATPRPAQAPAVTEGISHDTPLYPEGEDVSPHPDPAPTSRPVGKARQFFQLWAGPITACGSAPVLEAVLARCSRDWLSKATQCEEDTIPETHTAGPRHQSRGRKPQSRQQQRVRKRRRFNPDEASSIQKLYRVYPRRAVRHILGEQSAPYSGTAADAESFLRDTYCRPSPDPIQLSEARALFDGCLWTTPSPEVAAGLNIPPSRDEIRERLKRASNTAPGSDGIEYRHLRRLDPEGRLLEIIYKAVWELGIPDAWRRAKTVPIHKKGDTADYANFRPISMLPTIYKILSGIIASKIATVAVDLGWTSPEQKGFLPGVRGIQEHTALLHTAIEEAKARKGDLVVSWLDLANAFGSIPHEVLGNLFDAIPLPGGLRALLKDVYSGNVLDFVVGPETIPIHPSAGVRQGDPLSCIVFNLAAEPLVRAAKSSSNPGFLACGSFIKATAYADDIAVITSSTDDLQETLDVLSATASTLGLKFNARKCAFMQLKEGKAAEASIFIESEQIRCLGPEEQEPYLGIPIGAKLRFRPSTSMVALMDKVASSLLAPWQKLEILRSNLLPSLAHELASGRVAKETLALLDTECAKFLRFVCDLPDSSTRSYFYADRSAGGLGFTTLADDADVWTIARAAQLLTSTDPTIRSISWSQLNSTIRRGLRLVGSPDLPVGPYLSGSSEGALYRLRYGTNPTVTLWSLARSAAKRMKVQFDVSGDQQIRLIADDIAVLPLKAVKGLRLAIRQRWTAKLVEKPYQGRVAAGLYLDSSKDIARMTAGRGSLSIRDWQLLHRSRLDLLPLRGHCWSNAPATTCRRCFQGKENTFHVTNNCRMALQLYTQRHNAIQGLLVELLKEKGFGLTVDEPLPNSLLRPDIRLYLNGQPVLIDVTSPHDEPPSLEAAYQIKVEKYANHGKILPLVVGSLGSWWQPNNEIRSLLSIDARSWNRFRQKSRLAAIQGSLDVIRAHLAEPPPPDE